MVHALVVVDVTARPSYNRDRFLAYDDLLRGSSRAHRRYRRVGPAAVIFLSPHREQRWRSPAKPTRR